MSRIGGRRPGQPVPLTAVTNFPKEQAGWLVKHRNEGMSGADWYWMELM